MSPPFVPSFCKGFVRALEVCVLPLSRSYRFWGSIKMINIYDVFPCSSCPRGLSYVPPLRVPVIW